MRAGAHGSRENRSVAAPRVRAAIGRAPRAGPAPERGAVQDFMRARVASRDATNTTPPNEALKLTKDRY